MSDPTITDIPKARRRWKGMRITGYLQVTLGIFSVSLGVIAIVFRAMMYISGYPIWSAIFFYIIAGVLGIAAGRRQKRSLVIGYLTMSIIAAVFAGAMLVGYSIAMVLDGVNHYCPDLLFGTYMGLPRELLYRVGCSSSSGSRAAINGVIMVIGLAEGIVAIVGASMTCCNLCCSRTSGPAAHFQRDTQVVVVGPQAQAVVVPQQQFVQQPVNFGNAYGGQDPSLLQPDEGELKYQPAAQEQGHDQAPPIEKPSAALLA